MTCFIPRAYIGTGVSHSQRRKKIGRGFGKNAGEWTGRIEISEEEIPGSKRSMYGYMLIYSRLYGKTLSSVFSPDGTLISASVAPHREVFEVRFVILLLFWYENATMSFRPSLSSIMAVCTAELPIAYFRFKSTTE